MESTSPCSSAATVAAASGSGGLTATFLCLSPSTAVMSFLQLHCKTYDGKLQCNATRGPTPFILPVASSTRCPSHSSSKRFDPGHSLPNLHRWRWRTRTMTIFVNAPSSRASDHQPRYRLPRPASSTEASTNSFCSTWRVSGSHARSERSVNSDTWLSRRSSISDL